MDTEQEVEMSAILISDWGLLGEDRHRITLNIAASWGYFTEQNANIR